MINLKAKDEMGTNVAYLIAALIFAGTLLFTILVPKPTAQSVLVKRDAEERSIVSQVTKDHADLALRKAKVAEATWAGPAEKIGPGALTAMNALALKHKVKLSGFRPERTSETAGLELVPYTVTAEGAFPDVLSFTKDIENPATKLCVDAVMIASSDANGDQVTANVGITAYRVQEGANG